MLNKLAIERKSIIADDPYFQAKTKRRAGCRIDYMVQTRDRILYICEIKFTQDKVGMQIIDEIESKIAAIDIPKNYTYRSVLIHVNGVTEELLAADYFSCIISFAEFLQVN